MSADNERLNGFSRVLLRPAAQATRMKVVTAASLGDVQCLLVIFNLLFRTIDLGT